MFDFHEKRRIRSFIYSKYSIALLLILTGVLLVSVHERFSIEREMAEKKELRELELEALRVRAALLEERVEHLTNDRGIEEELRSRFDVIKENEQVVIIIDDEPEGTEENREALLSPPGTKDAPEKKSFLSMFKFW